jgi:hypothetical protein
LNNEAAARIFQIAKRRHRDRDDATSLASRSIGERPGIRIKQSLKTVSALQGATFSHLAFRLDRHLGGVAATDLAATRESHTATGRSQPELLLTANRFMCGAL